MQSFMMGLQRFVHGEEGVTMVEYGLIAALIAIVCIVAITQIGLKLNLVYEAICKALNNNAACA